MGETPEQRIKRLKMRSMRRGIKEMDLILGSFSEQNLGGMNDAALELYDALLNENDQDLYQWVTGQVHAPARFAALIDDIAGTLGK